MITRRGFILGTSGIALAGALENRNTAWAMTRSAPKTIFRKTDNLSPEEILAWLKDLRGQPYVLQSGFDVTSVFRIRSSQETYYVAGVNVENKELTVGTCAEEGAIAAAIAALGQDMEITEGWVMGAPRAAVSSDIACYPCGECRQRIAQYAPKNAPIHMIALDGECKDTKTRDELIPHAFSFRDLQHQGEKSSQAVSHHDIETRLYRNPDTALNEAQLLAWLADVAGDVRVSGRKESAILRLSNGIYVSGSKVENAAYPSGTNAVAAAVALMRARYGNQQIQEAWLSGGVPSGASLQILHQFAGSDMPLSLYAENGITKKAALRQWLPAAPLF